MPADHNDTSSAELTAPAAAPTSRESSALEASRLKSEFLTNMSHEIRTPLNGVVSMVELLLESPLNDDQREYARVALTSAEALMRVVNDILDISKIEAGRLEILSEDFTVESVVADACEIAGPAAREHGVELAVTIECAVPEVVTGDGSRVGQVLLNLLSNAVKFTPAGEIVVSVGVARDRLRFEVQDTGIGIDPSEVARLFQPFSQADPTTTRRYGGAGLGLAISRQLVELMGGEIGADSARGTGSTFWFELPCVRGTAPSECARQSDLTGTSVLVVDGSSTNRRILQQQLAHWGIVPAGADRGTAALQALQQACETGRPFGAALIDTHLPDISGLELARAIRANPAFRATRLVMLSSAGTGAEDVHAAGIELLLHKPVRGAQLHEALCDALAPSPRPAGSAPAAHDPADAPTADAVPILIAEDNEINQFAAARILRRLGFAVDIAHNGREAIELSADKRYAAIFMDCQMPEVDGYAATEAIRRREGDDGHTLIVAMTAHALEGDRERCLDAGMDDYIAKPLRLGVVAELLERRAAVRT